MKKGTATPLSETNMKGHYLHVLLISLNSYFLWSFSKKNCSKKSKFDGKISVNIMLVS